MTAPLITRRKALALTTLAAIPGVFSLGCSKSELSCADLSNLTADEITARTQVLGYVEKSPDPTKTCAKCQLYKPTMEGQCGGCTIVKGPINPAGNCKSFAVKVAPA